MVNTLFYSTALAVVACCFMGVAYLVSWNVAIAGLLVTIASLVIVFGAAKLAGVEW